MGEPNTLILLRHFLPTVEQAIIPKRGITISSDCSAVRNDLPGLLDEMQIGRAGEKLARKETIFLPTRIR